MVWWRAEQERLEEEGILGNIERFVSNVISGLKTKRSSQGPGRPAVMPALALWAGMLVCVLRKATTQSALWRLLRVEGLWWFPRYEVCDQAVYKRLATEGIRPLVELFEHVTSLLCKRLGQQSAMKKLATFAKGIYVLDQSTLEKLARKLPTLRGLPAGDPRLLGGAIAALFDLRRQLWCKVIHTDNAVQNEKVLARQVVEGLPAGSLILADLGYFAFAWFDWLTGHGYWWVSRLKGRVTYELQHVYYEQGETLDAIVWLGKYRADRAAEAVRLVCFRIDGILYRYVTNVLDPLVLPLEQIAALYARRWDIEMAFALVKRSLGLHLLWSAKPQVIEQQLWAVLIISQILGALRLEIAQRAGCDVFEVSIALMVEYLPQYAAKGLDPIATFVQHGRRVGFIRPSRRIQIRAPSIAPQHIVPMPQHLTLHRTARYAQKNCTSRNQAHRGPD